MANPHIVTCPACGAQNRIANDKLAAGGKPVCGRCKAPLAVDRTAGDGPLTVSDATFAAAVEQSPVPVLLDAWAPWCGPCRMVAPSIDELARELAGQVRVVKLNVDDNPQTAGRFDVRSIPTMLVLVEGREIGRIVGAQPKAAIREQLEQALARSAGTDKGATGRRA
jgi:thioredoxin 2